MAELENRRIRSKLGTTESWWKKARPGMCANEQHLRCRNGMALRVVFMRLSPATFHLSPCNCTNLIIEHAPSREEKVKKFAA